LATDGLEVLSGNEIASIIKEHEESSAEEIAKSLMDAVEKKQAEYQDNTTVIVLRVNNNQPVVKRLNDQSSESDVDSEQTVIIDAANQVAPTEKRKKWFSRLLPLVVLVLSGIVLAALSNSPAKNGWVPAGGTLWYSPTTGEGTATNDAKPQSGEQSLDTLMSATKRP
jgi:hypothetical protein